MSLDYSDIAKRARPGAAFSNGSEFEQPQPVEVSQ